MTRKMIEKLDKWIEQLNKYDKYNTYKWVKFTNYILIKQYFPNGSNTFAHVNIENGNIYKPTTGSNHLPNPVANINDEQLPLRMILLRRV